MSDDDGRSAVQRLHEKIVVLETRLRWLEVKFQSLRERVDS